MLVRSLIVSYLSVTLSLMTPIILTTPTIPIIPKKPVQVELSLPPQPLRLPRATIDQTAKQSATPVPTPLSLATSRGVKGSRSLSELRDEIEAYLKRQEGEYGLYYLDLTSGVTFGVNEQDSFAAASTSKVPVVLYLYTLINEGKVKPTEQITYQSSDWCDGSGSIRYQSVGSRYTVVELAERALVDSDNVALVMLKRRLGDGSIMAFCKRLGAPMVDSGDGETSPRSMGVYLQALYQLAQRSQWGKLMFEQMISSDIKDRIPALLPADLPVANKHGNLQGVINDVAVVLDERPYALAILTRDVPYFDAPAVLARVSKMIYEGR